MSSKNILEAKYPNITRFVEEYGWIEIGQHNVLRSFVRGYSYGGTIYEGKSSYKNLDAALQDLEIKIKDFFKELGV